MIDDLDRKLIKELQRNVREANTRLARKLGVDETTIRRRLSRLVSEGVILPTVIPDPSKTGRPVGAIVQMAVQPRSLDAVAKELAAFDEVHYVALISGRFDLYLWVLASSVEELFDFVKNKLAAIDGVQDLETSLTPKIIKRTWGWLP